MRLHLPDDDLEVSHRIDFSEALREGDGPARGPEIVLNLQKFFIIRGPPVIGPRDAVQNGLWDS